MKPLVWNLLLLLSLVTASCRRDPESIRFGKENCEFCKMTIGDRRFGAEIMTSKGKAIKFDAIECLASYVNQTTVSEDDRLWVVNYNNPDHWIEADRAVFLQTEQIKSPMGKNLAALGSTSEAGVIQLETGNGTVMRWPDVLTACK